MNNAKIISKAKIAFGAILLTLVMLLTLVATPLIAHAATTQKITQAIIPRRAK